MADTVNSAMVNLWKRLLANPRSGKTIEDVKTLYFGGLINATEYQLITGEVAPEKPTT